MPVGLGMGSSTSDVLAAVRAVAASHGVSLSPETIARLAVRAEGASDPVMLEGRPVLFAQREGRCLERFPRPMPPMTVVGCLTGDAAAVDTLALSGPRNDRLEVDHFEALRADLRRAIAGADVWLLGRVSTESARLNQRVLPNNKLALLQDVATAVGATGVQIAHSGTVAGLIFDPTKPGLELGVRRCLSELRHNGIWVTTVFQGAPSRWVCRSSRPRHAAAALHE